MNTNNRERLRSTRDVIAASELPTLAGDYQQIELAKTIRIDMILKANRLMAKLHQRVHLGDLSPGCLQQAMMASLRLRDTTLATWWIARRNMSMGTLLQELAHRSYAMESARN